MCATPAWLSFDVGQRHTPTNNDWQEIWNARAHSLSAVLGPPYDNVCHAPLPFAPGGNADILRFSGAAFGIAYVTAELTGKPNACYADYELMICHRSHDDWGPNIISRLAPYTQQAYIAAGETMDIDDATPTKSGIKAFLFDTYGTFRMFDQTFALRLCVGITKAELQFKMTHGAGKLLDALKQSAVHPFTDLDRVSVALESR